MWINTDDLQYVNKISEGVYHIVEARYAEDRYLLCHGRVDIHKYLNGSEDYDEECKSIICVYYGSVEEFHNAYMDSETRKQILAEMIFEERSYEDTNWKLVSKDNVETELLNMIRQLEYLTN